MASATDSRKKVQVPRTVTVGGQTFFQGEAHVKPEHATGIAAAAKRLDNTRIRRQVEDEPAGRRASSKKARGGEAATEDEIPGDFPHAAILGNEENDITTLTELRSMSDEELLALKDIGDERLADIRKALEDLD